MSGFRKHMRKLEGKPLELQKYIRRKVGTGNGNWSKEGVWYKILTEEGSCITFDVDGYEAILMKSSDMNKYEIKEF